MDTLERAPENVRTEGDRFYVIALTGEGDNCLDLELGDVIDQLNIGLGPVAARAIADFHLLSISIGVPISVEPQELAKAVAGGIPEQGYVVIIVDELMDLNELFDVLDRLLDPESAREACSRVQEILGVQSESYGVDLGQGTLEAFCANLP